MGVVRRIRAGAAAVNIGETIEIGPFTVRCGMRPDNPAWPVYLIYRRDKLIGRQFSMPSRSDCDSLQAGGALHGDAYESRAEEKPKLRGIAAESTWRRKAAA
jgi:hypothetical protein